MSGSSSIGCWIVRGGSMDHVLHSVMQDYAGTASFERGIDAFDFTKLNKQIADEFVSSLARQVQEEVTAGKPNMRSHVERATQTLASIRSGDERLGMPPDDLFDVL